MLLYSPKNQYQFIPITDIWLLRETALVCPGLVKNSGFLSSGADSLTFKHDLYVPLNVSLSSSLILVNLKTLTLASIVPACPDNQKRF